MKVNRLIVNVYLKEDIDVRSIHEKLSIMINDAMNNDSVLSDIHVNCNRYKYYSYSSLIPRANNGVFRRGDIYRFYLNAQSKDVLYRFKKALNGYVNETFIVCEVHSKTHQIMQIKSIKSETPSVITIKDSFNLGKIDLIFMRKRIIANAIRKYNRFYNEDIEENYNFISNIEVLYKYPKLINYKQGKILGYEYRLTINEDELSQKIAETMLNSGMLEKNSLGLGFCVWNC